VIWAAPLTPSSSTRTTLDALAIERVVGEMRREAASREGRSVSALLMRVAARLEERQAR